MHHLEPLSWNAVARTHGAQRHRHGASKGLAPTAYNMDARAGERFEIAFASRTLFRFIAVFRQGAQRAADPLGLAATAGAVLELARLDFDLIAWQPWCNTHFRSDCKRCIAELEDLVAGLSTGKAMAPFDLLHAMDGLMVLLVAVDARRRLSDV